MALAIRPIRPEEASAAQALLHAAHAWNLANGFNFTAADISLETLLPRLAPTSFFVAAEGDRLLGTIEIKPEPEAPGAWSLHLLAVDPAGGRQGVGRALIAFAETHARRAGASELRLDTPETHPWLPRFYAGRGYATFGTTRWDGKHYRSVLMRKPLQ